jgi:hypothetical protein
VSVLGEIQQWTAMIFDQQGFIVHLLPTITGLLICNAALAVWYKRLKYKERQ